MIRIGMGPPTITQRSGLWGEPIPKYDVNSFLGYVCVDQLVKILNNQQISSERMMKPFLWKIDIIGPDLTTTWRIYSSTPPHPQECKKIVRWTWVDTYVRYPLFVVYAGAKTVCGTLLLKIAKIFSNKKEG